MGEGASLRSSAQLDVVDNQEIAAFLKQDHSWIPSFVYDYRNVLHGTPTVAGKGVNDCAEEAKSLLHQLGHPDPWRLKDTKLIAVLALMNTREGLSQDSANSILRECLYLLRPIAQLDGGPKHVDWHDGIPAMMVASYHLRLLRSHSPVISATALVDHSSVGR
jgi:hypothetical protein